MMARNTRATLLLLTAFLLAAAVAAAQAPPAAGGGTHDARVFREARGVGADAARLPEAFEFELSGYSYRVGNNGSGRRTKDGKTRLFNLRLDGPDFIERIYFDEYEGNVILACEVSDGDAGAGLVLRLEQPSMRARWRRAVPTFNVGPPARDGAGLYLTALNFVARLDLDSGRYVWRLRDLNAPEGPGRGEHFYSFAAPEFAGDEVLFREAGRYNRPLRTLRVNKKTGRLVGVE
ncbi:MAG TPA: hypothetical protein VEY09_11295 [Pyrinomonadaceae bacterium]|nr:hypothetical protein [Pyrinomonadaceae bacterium]